MSAFFIACVVALPVVVSSGGFAAFLDGGGEFLSVVDASGEEVFVLDAWPGERLSYPAFDNLKLVFVSSSRGLVQHDVLNGEVTVITEERTGAPWFSSDGDLWYTSGGFLYCNGTSSGIAVEAFSVSVDGGCVAFTNRNDDLHILDMESGTERTVQGYRFYSPQVLSDRGVIAPTLTGEIVYLPPDGSLMVLGHGEQPCWSSELEGIFYCVSEDDGHSLVSADIWFVSPGGEPVRVTFTDGVNETRPSSSGDLLWFVDEITGEQDCVSVDDLSL